MARAALNWTQETLAAAAKVDVATVKRMEATDGPVSARTDTVLSIVAVLEKAGIEFPEDPPGVVTVRYHLSKIQNRRR